MQYVQCQPVKPNRGRNEIVVGCKNVDEEMCRQLKQTREAETQRHTFYGRTTSMEIERKFLILRLPEHLDDYRIIMLIHQLSSRDVV